MQLENTGVKPSRTIALSFRRFDSTLILTQWRIVLHQFL